MDLHPPLYNVTAFSIVGPYELDVTFDDGLTQRVNLSEFLEGLEGGLFGPLNDQDVFNGVRLDEECHNLVWPNGADFDPATLHDWPEVKGAMIAMAREWAARG
jgi:hypothetical protein